MKRKRIRKVSSRQRVILDCRRLLREIKIEQLGGKFCEICLKPRHKSVGLFHILNVGTHPRLQFHEQNVLLAGWMPCHYFWHHYPPDSPRAQWILERVKELRGKNYRDRLLSIEAMAPKLTMHYLKLKRMQLKQQLQELKEG